MRWGWGSNWQHDGIIFPAASIAEIINLIEKGLLSKQQLNKFHLDGFLWGMTPFPTPHRRGCDSPDPCDNPKCVFVLHECRNV